MTLKSLIVESKIKKLKTSIDLECGSGYCLFITSIGHDTNGNWSYMVAKGANKAKKIQHQGDWGAKITKDTTQSEAEDMKVYKEITKYYLEFSDK